jgi:hypothetical protein
VVLSITLGLISSYVGIDKLIEYQQLQIIDTYQQGFNDGAGEAVSHLFEQTQNCQISKIEINNKSKSLFDFACLGNNSDTRIMP